MSSYSDSFASTKIVSSMYVQRSAKETASHYESFPSTKTTSLFVQRSAKEISSHYDSFPATKTNSLYVQRSEKETSIRYESSAPTTSASSLNAHGSSMVPGDFFAPNKTTSFYVQRSTHHTSRLHSLPGKFDLRYIGDEISYSNFVANSGKRF